MRRIGTVSAVLTLAIASSAQAAFPGRDGELAIAPAHGSGIVLIRPNGSDRTTVCAPLGRCGPERDPHWSPDGRAIAVGTAAGSIIVYPDGTCEDCHPMTGSRPAFTPSSSTLTVSDDRRLVRHTVDGVPVGSATGRDVSDAVWSAGGTLAEVRSDEVLAARPGGRLRTLGPGSMPSWSPDGRALAVVRGGSITVLTVGGRRARTVARGSSPAWSPDGRLIAFIAPGHRVGIVAASGGAVRTVPGVRGRSLDWQPVPTTPPPACVPPSGSKVVTQSADAVVTVHSFTVPIFDLTAPTYMGCLRTDGRERVLESLNLQDPDSTTTVSSAAVDGDYAALINSAQDPHYGGNGFQTKVFDLRTGQPAPGLGRETVSCPDDEYECSSRLDGLVLGPDGVSAVHTTTVDGTELTERIVVSDHGVFNADTVQEPSIDDPTAAPLLGGLRLSGHVLSWTDRGAPRELVLG